MASLFDLSRQVVGSTREFNPMIAPAPPRPCESMVLKPRGLLISLIGHSFAFVAARRPALIVSMVIAGCGAGLLNGTTVKVMGSVAPPDRAGMASRLTSTTRFIGILVAVDGLGSVLASGA